METQDKRLVGVCDGDGGAGSSGKGSHEVVEAADKVVNCDTSGQPSNCSFLSVHEFGPEAEWILMWLKGRCLQLWSLLRWCGRRVIGRRRDMLVHAVVRDSRGCGRVGSLGKPPWAWRREISAWQRV